MKKSIKMLETIVQDYLSNSRDQATDESTRALLLAIHTVGANGKAAHAQDMYSIPPERINAIFETSYRNCEESTTAEATAQRNLSPYAKSITDIMDSILLGVINNYDSHRKTQIFERTDFQENLLEGIRRLAEFPE